MRETEFTYNQKKYRISSDFQNDHIFKIIDTHKTFYEVKLLEAIKKLNLDGVAIDIGANIGNHSLFFAKECKFQSVDCYELSDKIYNVLLKNQKLNNCINIHALNIGLSDKPKRVGVSKIDEKNIGMTHIIEGDTVGLSTLDIIYKNYTNKISLIKIDTEGSEYDILVGGINLIKKDSPVLVIEIQNEEIFKKINSFLENINYKTDKISYTHTPTYIWKRIQY